MEVAVRPHRAVIDDERTFRRAVELDLDLLARFGKHPMQSAMNLRRDAQRQRILYPSRRSGLEQRAAAEQLPQDRADFDLTARGSRPQDALVQYR